MGTTTFFPTKSASAPGPRQPATDRVTERGPTPRRPDSPAEQMMHAWSLMGPAAAPSERRPLHGPEACPPEVYIG